MTEYTPHILVFIVGLFLILNAILAALRYFVVPRNEAVLINGWAFSAIRHLFDAVAALSKTYAKRDAVMALFAPMSLFILPIVWLLLISLGYTAIYWALGEGTWSWCFKISNSALLTLGADKADSLVANIFSYSEATLGLLLLTLLISYLPTMYQAYSRRELVVARLERRAGTPTSAPELMLWLHRTAAFTDNGSQWRTWEEWFVELEESHTSLAILVFFRSPQPGRSWVTAAGSILDAAALTISALDQPRDPFMELCFKSGSIAINRIYRYFEEKSMVKPPHLSEVGEPMKNPDQEDFNKAYDRLRAAGLPMRPDQQAAWEQYHTLRRHYTHAVEYLSQLTMAPEIKPIAIQQ